MTNIECPQIRNAETSNCLDTLGGKAGQPLGMGYCHGMGGNQVNTYSLQIQNKIYKYKIYKTIEVTKLPTVIKPVQKIKEIKEKPSTRNKIK